MTECFLTTPFYFIAMPCSMWTLVPQPGIEPMTPVLGVQRLKHRTAREVLDFFLEELFLL